MKSSVILSPGLSNFLNFIRWIAALLVVITHIRTLLFDKLEHIDSSSLPIQIFYFFTSLGGEAVMVFFVLSGFLVGGKIFTEFKNDTFNWKEYLIKRISRLYVVLVPALIIGGILNIVGLYYFNDTGIYNNALHLVPFDYDIESRITVTTFFSNLFMFQTTFTPTFGSNGPLWSLANEFWYYILFPLMLTLWYRDDLQIKFLSFLGLFILTLVLNFEIILYFSIWLVGVIAYRFIGIKIPFTIAIIIFCMALFFDVTHFFPYQKIGSLTLAVSVAILILSTNHYKFKYFKRLNNFFADSSYSLYLFHDPFILFIFSAFTLSPFQKTGFNIFLIFLLSSYFYSMMMYFFFERNTSKLRNILFRFFHDTTPKV